MKNIIVLVVASLIATLGFATKVYHIEHSSNDEVFIINSEVFKAKSYCFNMEKGDRVIFIKGKPNGVCVSAEIYNLRTEKTCRVWCE
jgi:hypothetical protein